MTVLDDRWEWIEERTFGSPEPQYVRGRCRHREVVPVESLGVLGPVEVVAHLCLTCDAQLPAEWLPDLDFTSPTTAELDAGIA